MNKPLNPTQLRVKALLEEAKKLSGTPEFNENADFTLHLLWSYPAPDHEKGRILDGVIKGVDSDISAMMAKNMDDDKVYRKLVLKSIGVLFVSHPELIQHDHGADD